MKNATIARAKDAYSSDFYGMTSRDCDSCDLVFTPSDFVAIDGAVITCLACYMDSAKLSAKEFSKTLKTLIGCESCGYSRHSFALQYDHTNHAEKYRTKSGKLIHPSDLFRTCSSAVFSMEVSKCVIRCANCHAEKTARERGL